MPPALLPGQGPPGVAARCQRARTRPARCSPSPPAQAGASSVLLSATVGPAGSRRRELRCTLLRCSSSRAGASSADSLSPPLPVPAAAKEETDFKSVAKFAAPALGIFVLNPVLTLIDTAWVGRVVGAVAQSALNPSSVILDFPMLVLSFLSTATTNLISREASREEAVKKVLRLSYTLALCAGSLLFLYHAFASPSVLGALGTPAPTVVEALKYIRVRSLFSPLVLVSSCSMAALLALRDPLTPLRWSLAGAAVNCIGNFLLCNVFPLGIAGAAWATVASQSLVLCGLLSALHARKLLPSLWPPPPLPLLAPFAAFAGPVSALSAVRVAGFVALAAHANSLADPSALAAHQISVSILVLLSIAGEPLNAAGQTQLPRLYPGGAAANPRAAADLVATLVRAALCVGVGSSTLGAAALLLGGKYLAASPDVLAQLVSIVPPYIACLALTATAVVLDGTLVARKDFAFLVPLQLAAFGALVAGLAACRTLVPEIGLAAIWVSYLGYLLMRVVAFALRLKLVILKDA